jgi:hypothetical protein
MRVPSLRKGSRRAQGEKLRVPASMLGLFEERMARISLRSCGVGNVLVMASRHNFGWQPQTNALLP